MFEGGFDVAQADKVIGAGGAGAAAGDALDHLLALGEHSLIARDQAPIDAARLAGRGIRFEMLRTVQGYALARLADDGPEPEVRRRHAEAYVELAEAAAQHLFAAEQPAWLDRLTLDESNLRAAPALGDRRRRDATWRFGSSPPCGATGRSAGTSPRAAPGPRQRWSCPAPRHQRQLACGRWARPAGIAYWRSEHERSVAHYREQLRIAEQIRDTAGDGRRLVQPGVRHLCRRRLHRFRATRFGRRAVSTSSSATSAARTESIGG